jgi:hypothetical protein
MFIAARFILGFGLAITSNAAPTLVIEIAHPTHRGKITALYNTMWYLGSSKLNIMYDKEVKLIYTNTHNLHSSCCCLDHLRYLANQE